MIVTCERCATQFQLDDERVPEEGVRVRCSRCKHAFFIELPARTEAEKIHRVAQRALADQEIPDVAEDLPADGASQSDARHAAVASGAGHDDPWGDDEDDWQFNLDGPPESGTGEAPASAPLEDAGDAVDELLATEDEFDGEDAVDEVTSEAAEGGGDHSAPLLDSNTMPPSGLDLAGDALAAVAEVESEEDVWEQPAPDAMPEAGAALTSPESRPPEPTDALEGPTSSLVRQDPDELAGPDEWDLFGGDVPAAESPGIASTQPRGLGTVPVARRPSISKGPAPEQGRALSPGLQRAGRAVGWLVAIGLFGFGLHGGLVGAGRQVSAASAAVQIGGVRLDSVSGHWIDNLLVGPLFVVSGIVENTGGGATTSLLVELLDADGRRLDSPPVFVGPALSARALREKDPLDLQRIQEGRRLSAASLNEGESRPFHAIVTGVPQNAFRFRFAPSTAHDAPALPTSSATAATSPADPASSPNSPTLSASASAQRR